MSRQIKLMLDKQKILKGKGENMVFIGKSADLPIWLEIYKQKNNLKTLQDLMQFLKKESEQ